MDRTAWIVVALCVVGLLLWEFYFAKQMAPRPAPITAASGHASPTTAPEVRVPSPSPLATPEAVAHGVETAPAFAEKVETLRNSDVELRLTNRGGGITEAIMLGHTAEDAKRVVLNSAKQMPIGAMVDDPATPVLPEFVLSRESENSIRCERLAPDGITVRKKFSLTQTAEKKDNFVVDLDVEVLNTGAQPYANADYFVALGSAAPIHPRDYPYYTRVVWCVDGKAKGIDVNWFSASSGFLGMRPRPAQRFYQQDLANGDWVGASDQFFTTLIAPLTGKANGVWGRLFDISPEQKMFGLTGALRMPG